MKPVLGLAAIVVLAVAGCMTAAEHQQSLGSAAEREMTVGIVQKEIHTGLSQAEVAEALGSPNIVTRDATGKETWIYDKIASEASYSNSAASGGVILIVGVSRAAGASATTQKTLTVVIKFDGEQRVDSFSYHASRF